MIQYFERFSNNYEALSGLTGLLIGFPFYFSSPSIPEMLIRSLIIFLVFVAFGSAFRSLLRGSKLKSAIKFSAGILILTGVIGIIYTSTSNIAGGVKYNQITGECETANKAPGFNHKGFAWYYSGCDGEALEKFCESRADEGKITNISRCLENPRNQEELAFEDSS